MSLAKQKYFDATPCHRLTTAGIYVLQCGDPTGSGTGGPGYAFADELTGKEKYTGGVVAMAHTRARTPTAASSSSSTRTPDLRSCSAEQYTVFGTVTKGLDVVDRPWPRRAPTTGRRRGAEAADHASTRRRVALSGVTTR